MSRFRIRLDAGELCVPYAGDVCLAAKVDSVQVEALGAGVGDSDFCDSAVSPGGEGAVGDFAVLGLIVFFGVGLAALCGSGDFLPDGEAVRSEGKQNGTDKQQAEISFVLTGCFAAEGLMKIWEYFFHGWDSFLVGAL